jgi:carboxymethylenebutenolidase
MACRHIELNANTPRAIRAQLCIPELGSGPGLVICADAQLAVGTAQRLCELFSDEGYVAVALHAEGGTALDQQDVATAVDALRKLDCCKGSVGAVTYGQAVIPALECAVRGLVACVSSYRPTALEACADKFRRVSAAVLLHVRQPLDASIANAVRENSNVQVHEYPDGGSDGWLPGDAGAPHTSGIAHSRTLGLLRSTIGPRYDLSALWDAHRNCEFVTRDADATMRTMVQQPYVNHVPTMTGGYGSTDLRRFYHDHFIPNNPADMRSIPISRTVGADRVVNETILCFTHDREIEWMLPGVPPTGKYVEVALVGIITFRGGKLAHEHIYWDQASVLAQIGLLDTTGLPVTGAAAARKVLDPSLPSNELMPSWRK